MPGSPQTVPQESRRGQMLTAARNLLHAATREAALTTTPPPSSGDRRFEWAMIAGCSWFLGGLYLDGWAHNHIPQLETFFTPWHGVFYSGFLAVAGLTVATLLRNHAQGAPWRRALPLGYLGSLLGVAVFAAGGIGDMIWHAFFGIEADVEALFSPTHVTLALGMTLIVSGPWRAAWRRAETPALGGLSRLPMLLSLTFTFMLLTFMTQFAHPLVATWAGVRYRPSPAVFGQVTERGMAIITFRLQAVGMASILLQASLLMGVVLLAVRRWGRGLPLGGLTLLFAVNASAMSVMQDQYRLIPGATLAGVAADLLRHRLQPSPTRPGAWRLFAFAVPAIFYALYFLTLKLTEGIWWSVHLWTGAIVLAGMVGWLLSYVLVPPSWPAAPDADDATTCGNGLG
jgi:hypothetical protein